eukprot:TRINITY_DN4653_c0_g1_i1.p2 TRINITY_DN4653_c0_g1~~TRINITY_DN4653_c0_g1_i1.p2  ORF type:complete len:130 (+),score=46.58 TRINITY_DN4653_c0_g1_i1:425-814(+)
MTAIPQQQRKTLYVGGLEDQVTEAILKAAFLPFGDLVDVIVPLDHSSQKHRGFGFVEYELPEDAQAALENMHESELFGKVLHCNLAKPTQLSKHKAVWAESDYFEGQAAAEGAEGTEALAEENNQMVAE